VNGSRRVIEKRAKATFSIAACVCLLAGNIGMDDSHSGILWNLNPVSASAQ
jgi:hypothetical protein